MEGSQTPHLPWFSSQSRLYQEYISPRVSTNAEGIQDIVEASPMQTKFIESSLLRGRGSTNYFAFHLKGNVDEARLYKVCQALFAKHPIRRTSFVAFKRRLFQVILRSLSPEFYAFECPESQQKQVAVRWVEAHRDEPVSLGQPILHFLFLGGKGESMLVMRFSHAHYDIWGSLIAAAHVDVSVEEMVEHPNMLAQSILLAKQMHVSINPGTHTVVDVRTITRRGGELSSQIHCI
ncbi:unnamed protein product [Clonostachys rosea f. rosea IK726]|uniref:Uncharacterized protein n=1 Tax=Clonostachys rosea f. rosea IK726 TaxID=1349383 RepID=A0ACA9TM03_BIOOC|nr:unnamed protein product [Clonostachys rosea f. rosea IK726]